MKELEDFMACYSKDRRGMVSQVKDPILPDFSLIPKVTNSPTVSAEDVLSIVNEKIKHTDNHINMAYQMQ